MESGGKLQVANTLEMLDARNRDEIFGLTLQILVVVESCKLLTFSVFFFLTGAIAFRVL